MKKFPLIFAAVVVVLFIAYGLWTYGDDAAPATPQARPTTSQPAQNNKAKDLRIP